jgi:hypothetical protein
MSFDSDPPLQNAFSDFVSGKKSSLEDILSDRNFNHSTISAVKKLDINKLKSEYGEIGLERYIRSITDQWEDSKLGYERNDKKIRRAIKSVLMSPAKFVAKTYDYVLNKTGSHFISTIAMGALTGEILFSASFFGETFYDSQIWNIPFFKLAREVLPYNISLFIELPAVLATFSAFSVGMIAGATTSVFNHKKIREDEIKDDIKKYSRQFRKIFSNYSHHIYNSSVEDSLQNLNAIYMLSSSKAYSKVITSEDNLRYYERSMVPYIEQVLHKKVNPALIFHHSPKNVGGFTLIYNSLIGKIFNKKSYSPVFLNTDRITALPEYLFALFHEISHGAGATTEQMASYYAQVAMEKTSKSHKLEGYDLFMSANKLESAVATLAKKFKSSEEFFLELDNLNLPKFVKDSFNYEFNPLYSINFPVAESLNAGPIESKFSGLYASGPYIASKMVEKGRVKTF